MKAIFLCAGNAKRMLTLSEGFPKPMVQVGYKEIKPILEHAISNCRRVEGIDEFLLVVRKGDNVIKNYFGDGTNFNVKITYVTQEEALGTAHAIRCVENYVSDAFIVVYGDNIFTKGLIDHTRLIHEHGTRGAVATYALHHEPDRTKLKEFGTAEVNDEHHIIRITEKSESPPSNYVVTGILIFEPAIFDVMSDERNWRKSPRGEYEIHDYTNLLIKSGKVVNANISTAPWMDVTRPADVDVANKLFKEILRN